MGPAKSTKPRHEGGVLGLTISRLLYGLSSPRRSNLPSKLGLNARRPGYEAEYSLSGVRNQFPQSETMQHSFPNPLQINII